MNIIHNEGKLMSIKCTLLLEMYHNHFRETLKKYNVTHLRHLSKDQKRHFFNHLRDTWRSRKNSSLR